MSHFCNKDNGQFEKVCSFDLEIPKDAKTLKKFVSSDELRPIMQMICVFVNEQKMFASDGRVLSSRNVVISKLNNCAENVPNQICILPEIVDKYAGDKITVELFRDKKDSNNYFTLSGVSGELQKSEYYSSYPNALKVVPTFYFERGYIHFAKQGLSTVNYP